MSKKDLKEIGLVVLAYLLALGLLYIVFIKMKFLIH